MPEFIAALREKVGTDLPVRQRERIDVALTCGERTRFERAGSGRVPQQP